MKTQVSLAFFLLVCASLNIEVRAQTLDDEIAEILNGLTVYNDNNTLVNCNKKQIAQSDHKGEITFKLYTKKNPSYGQQLQINDTLSMEKGYFDATKPTYFITHGWTNTGQSPSCTLIRDAYLANTDSNVIIVDWSLHSMSLPYKDAAYKAKEIARAVRKMLKWLYSNGLKKDDVTLIGHSIGAHIMGIASYKLKSNKVKHIVGLDPALQMYNYADHTKVLSKEDAEHVQIIHTNGGGAGSMCPHGHSDFFPNGGSIQEGCCDSKEIARVTTWKQLLKVIVKCSACSHGRAYEFFAESITERFVATQCRSYLDFQEKTCGAKPRTALMGGLDLDSVKPGKYYLRTGSKKPFSKVRANSVNNSAVVPTITNALCNLLNLQ